MDLCPVAAVLSYVTQRGVDSGPFFRYTKDRALTREWFVSDVRLALQSAGIQLQGYSGHSFRIGAATMAAQCGLQDSLLKMLGQWESMTYMLYVQTPRETLCSMGHWLVACHPKEVLKPPLVSGIRECRAGQTSLSSFS